MRPIRFAAALIAAAGLVLAGCADDSEPSADDTNTTSATPSEDASDDVSESPSDEASDDSGESEDVGDFPEVDGFTLVSLPQAAEQAFGSAVQGVPQIDDFEGRLVKEGGKQVGFVIRIGVNVDDAALSEFEDNFLPAFAGGIAGTDAEPDFEEINGVNVVKIQGPSGSTAYAWVEDGVATVTTFNDAADAQAFAEGALE